MTVFPNIKRTYMGWSQHNEDAYHFFNRSAQPKFTAVRNRIEEWFAAYPEREKKALRNKFPKKFNDAFFELYLHQLFLNMGFNIEIEPEVSNKTKPDFLLEKDGYKFYVEAKFIDGESKKGKGVNKQLNSLFDQINALDLGNYYLCIEKLDINVDHTPSSKKLIKYIKRSVPEDGNEVRELKIDNDEIYFKGSLNYYEGKSLFKGADSFTIGFYPPTPANYPAAKFKDKISKKGKKYGELEHPLLICVGFNLAHILNDEYFEKVLFGGQVISAPKHSDGHVDFNAAKIKRVNKGLFWDNKGIRTSRASAILFTHITPNGSMGYRLYAHPEPNKKMDFKYFPIKRMAFVKDELKEIEGKELSSFVEFQK